jgi:hypothetical protein
MRIKKSVICTGIKEWQLDENEKDFYLPKSGDVALFEVLEIGKHSSLQCDDRRNHKIFPGDIVMMAFGARYATSQLHGLLPEIVSDTYHILGQGGVCGLVDSFNSKFELRGPTTLRLIGYVCDNENKIINTKYRHIQKVAYQARAIGPKLILSIGGSMDSGKTTTAGHLCRGLKAAGHKVGFIKLTGTIYTKDVDFVVDCGADFGMDFGLCGFPSTYLVEKEEMLDLFETLVTEAEKENPDYIVMEIADGIYQKETNYLLQSEIMHRVESIIYSDSNSTGAVSGLALLQQMNLSPFALCGSITTSPLMVDEVRNYCGIPVLTLDDLVDPSIIDTIIPASKSGLEVHLTPTMFHNLSAAV